jgi:hypothetical protein
MAESVRRWLHLNRPIFLCLAPACPSSLFRASSFLSCPSFHWFSIPWMGVLSLFLSSFFLLNFFPTHLIVSIALNMFGVQLIGVACKDCVIIACDGSVARGPVKFKNSEDKIYHVDGSKMMGVTGPTGDRVNFTEYIMRNIQLYALRNGVSLSTHAAANYTRYIPTAQAAQTTRVGPRRGRGESVEWCEEIGVGIKWIGGFPH